jgi:hypothetical protein
MTSVFSLRTTSARAVDVATFDERVWASAFAYPYSARR